MAGRRARRKAAEAKKAAGTTTAAPASPATPAPAASVRTKKTLREQRDGIASTHREQLLLARIQYLEKAAAWASSAVPPLGAFLGARLAATCEGAGMPLSATAQKSMCQRCESFLVPEVNCSVQPAKRSKRKPTKPDVDDKAARPATYLLHRCHYCQHGNKRLAPPPAKKARMAKRSADEPPEVEIRTPKEEAELEKRAQQQSVVASPFTPVPVDTGKKRKRKAFTTLKQLASRNMEESQAAKRRTLFGLPPPPSDPSRPPKLNALSNQMLRQLYSPG